ncbi:TRAP transporter small permease [Treponema parvum]|uniref:TRAP transporter small permease n=1 Tax=Treponema parvum TaxID=138851 RepID=A0A975ICZ9_9SPIR|nr:TRAP transporter small permease [Treponema parvum]QTQ11624.1 TRAP transporter small permease [Treponema parvum]
MKIMPIWIIKNLEEMICAFAAFAMVLICTANVFGRYVFNHAISWADEVDICLLAWVTFVGAAVGYKRNRHYGMDFILVRLPGKEKKMLRIILNGIIAATCIFLTYHSFVFAANARKVMPYTRLPYKYIDASAVVGFASMTVYSIVFLIEAFAFPKKYKERYDETDDKASVVNGEKTQ